MSALQQLLKRKREDVDSRKRKADFDITYAAEQSQNRRITWNRDRFRFIAEVKRASLSTGPIRTNLEAAELAASYEASGASAISVLTEEHYFQGSLNDLRRVRDAVSVPLLQKDFILDEFQIHEAKFYGASFVLLIAKLLARDQLDSFQKLCGELQINALVEVTDEADLEKISGPVNFLGVNSRNLETLQIDKEKFKRMRKLLPDAFLIAESGIQNMDSLAEIIDLGYHGALIGEHLLKSQNPGTELLRFVAFAESHQQVPARSRPRIKVCGITTEKDAMLSVKAGANALGFIFAESPRRVDPMKLRQFRSKIPPDVLCVGVFRDQTRNFVLENVKDFRLDIIQTYDPIQLKGMVWSAHVARKTSDIEQIRFHEQNHLILWDLKPEEGDLVHFWSKLGNEKVFALAGGLNPENVRPAVSLCNPEWVDVARGVESAPGIKDKAKLFAFVKEATE